MNRFGTLLGLVSALAIGGCDDGPSLNVVPEPAGANCPTGGFRVEADGEVFYSCNGQATTETVVAGAEGNPCFGDALRVTIPLEDGTTRYGYVCEAAPADPVLTGALTVQLETMVAQTRVECLCTTDPEDLADCENELALYETVLPPLEVCLGQAVAAAGAFPEADRPALTCLVNAYGMVNTCLDAIPASECSMDVAMAVDACEAMGDTSACAVPSTSAMDWFERVQAFASFLRCAPFGI